MRSPVTLMIACAVLVSACGDADTPARPASASPAATAADASNPAPHIIAANKTCMAAQPEFERARQRIDRAGKVLQAGAQGAERKRNLKLSRDAWMLRHDTMAELFTQLRDLQK